jgi:sporulation protein YlmC with PRC-barrel domain
MRVDLDAKVRARDGAEIGSVDRAVVDPRTNEVTHVVVRTGAIFGRDIVVPREDVERANQDGDTIQLDLTKDELERFPDFEPERFGAPPPAWVAPAGYGFPAGSYAWPVAMDPMLGPVAMTIPDELVDEETEEPDQVTLMKGALVLDRNGDDIGVVDDMRFDGDTGQLQGFVLRVGGALRTLFGGGDTVEVSHYQIDTVGESIVKLRLAKEEVEAAAEAASRQQASQ